MSATGGFRASPPGMTTTLSWTDWGTLPSFQCIRNSGFLWYSQSMRSTPAHCHTAGVRSRLPCKRHLVSHLLRGCCCPAADKLLLHVLRLRSYMAEDAAGPKCAFLTQVDS